MFENYLKCRILAFSPMFILLKLTCLVALFEREIDYFWHFYELLSTQNVNIARYARNFDDTFL